MVRMRWRPNWESESLGSGKASNCEKPVVMPAMRFVERSGRIEWIAAIAFSRPSLEHSVQSSSTLRHA